MQKWNSGPKTTRLAMVACWWVMRASVECKNGILIRRQLICILEVMLQTSLTKEKRIEPRVDWLPRLFYGSLVGRLCKVQVDARMELWSKTQLSCSCIFVASLTYDQKWFEQTEVRVQLTDWLLNGAIIASRWVQLNTRMEFYNAAVTFRGNCAIL